MLLLAPMEGVVDFIMRDLLTQIGGFDFCATEFVRVTHQLNPPHVFHKYCPELKTEGKTKAGTPVFIQLLGGDPQVMGENAALACELGSPGIDLNFGCPAKTVNRHDGGSVILQWPERVFAITQAVRKSTPSNIPVTVKVRLGFMDSSLALENALAAEEAGAHWLTVHARTKADAYKPPAKWHEITPLKEKLKIPLIANGDIWNEADAEACRKVTGCPDLMLGRGAIAQPFLARRLSSPNNAPTQTTVTTWEEVNPWFEFFAKESEKTSSLRKKPGYGLARCKQWLKLLSRNFPEAQKAFEASKRSQSFQEFMTCYRKTFEK